MNKKKLLYKNFEQKLTENEQMKLEKTSFRIRIFKR